MGHDALHTVLVFLSGSTATGIVAHAVNTFPQPQNVYWRWLLGTIQWAVGQRTQGAATIQNGSAPK